MNVTRSTLLSAAFFAAMALPMAAQDTQNAPDNSAHNQTQKTTADNQSNAAADRQMTANIRKAIIADKGLSLYAHNCKIITRDGSVVLKGPVKSDAEKNQVAQDAASVVSADHITNKLTVKQ